MVSVAQEEIDPPAAAQPRLSRHDFTQLAVFIVSVQLVILFVAGSSVFCADDPAAAFQALQARLG